MLSLSLRGTKTSDLKDLRGVPLPLSNSLSPLHHRPHKIIKFCFAARFGFAAWPCRAMPTYSNLCAHSPHACAARLRWAWSAYASNIPLRTRHMWVSCNRSCGKHKLHVKCLCQRPAHALLSLWLCECVCVYVCVCVVRASCSNDKLLQARPGGRQATLLKYEWGRSATGAGETGGWDGKGLQSGRWSSQFVYSEITYNA